MALLRQAIDSIAIVGETQPDRPTSICPASRKAPSGLPTEQKTLRWMPDQTGDVGDSGRQSQVFPRCPKGQFVILQPFDYNVANLLHSTDAVAICQLEGEKLKDMILDVREQDWGLVVVETTSKNHFIIFAASAVHEGNLVGDVRRWGRELGYEFFLKRSSEELSTPRPNIFVLPDGREIEIRDVFKRSSNFTHWGLGQRKILPRGYIRL